MNLRWPKRLRGSWLQSGGFLLIGLFSAVTLTDARVTAWVLLGLFGLAIGLSLVFERRAFCSYLCPIGGFTGIYAKTAPVEVRVIDTAICAAHSEKTCYQNCPWGLYPVALRDSAQCGLCMECLRSCPQDNIAVNSAPIWERPAAQRRAESSRLDEAFLALVMLGSALAFSAVFIGPWGSLKSAAFAIGSPAWLLYALGFLALNLVVMPGALCPGGLGRAENGPAARSSYGGRLPISLRFCSPWACLPGLPSPSLSPSPSSIHVLSVLSDPLGWGWNLLGTAIQPGLPDVTGFSPSCRLPSCWLDCSGLPASLNGWRRSSDRPNFRQAASHPGVLPGLFAGHAVAIGWIVDAQRMAWLGYRDRFWWLLRLPSLLGLVDTLASRS